MIILDGKNIYGISKYQLKRKNGNNETRYLVKYKGLYKRGFESLYDALSYLESLKKPGGYEKALETIPSSVLIRLPNTGIPSKKNVNEILKNKNISVADAVEQYLLLYKEQVTYGTYYKQTHYFKDVIVPNLPDIPVSELTNLDILEFRSRLNKDIFKMREINGEKELYATKSRNDILQQLKEFLFFAIDNYGVDLRVVKNVKKYKKTHAEKLKAKEKEENMWNIAEYYSFLDALEQYYGLYSPTYGIYLVIGNKGLRLGECLALKFIDLRYENMLVIDESITRKTENTLFEAVEPKTDSGDRKIRISSGLYSYLITCMEREKRKLDFDENWFIFHRPKNGFMPMAERTLNSHKKAALDAIGLRWNTNHQLRHLYNTYLKDQGVKVEDRSTTLGQRDLEVNSLIYTHLSDESIRKISDADEKLFNREKHFS